ncbi:hypothetical protein KVV02_004193 [Mortierella alpina]|uniref:Pheromone-regulated membrane protein 10 n=1 Tax=Mortierella alpina TaxID=64518 RepID=A0A9P8CY57_MORAP|nr:hypothetical protein KVV02_004193 [Mortierella alpina]
MNTGNSSPYSTPPQQTQPSSTASLSSLGLPAYPQIPTPPTIAVNPPSSSSAPYTSSATSSNARSLTGNFPTGGPRPTTRYNPPVPSRMSGVYSSNNSIYHSNLGPSNGSAGFRRGTSSASSSPPGTPPNGLRDYYLNAAYHRSQGRMHASGSATGSTTPQNRPNISVIVPSQQGSHSNGNSSTLIPQVTIPRRSYSADQLGVDEPHITVTTPGGSNSTEEHVMTLQRALDNLIEQEGRKERAEQGDDGREDYDGPLMMKDSKLASHPGATSAADKSGISITPKVLENRTDSDPQVPTLSHGIVGSDVTLGSQGFSEKEKKLKEKKKLNRISKLFNRESIPTQAALASAAAAVEQQQGMYAAPRPTVQPSRAGVLSNLLKLHGNSRQHKVRSVPHATSTPKHHKEKEKKKRSALYTRSANASVTSLATKSLFATYPPLPATTPHGSATAMATLNTASHRHNAHSNNNNHRNSFQLDGVFPSSFPPGNSPLQSPNISPRGSFSYDNSPSAGTTLHSLSTEEKMRITFAVADILQRQDYVLRLARAMIKFGAPSHRLEDAVDHTARTLELNLQCVYLPNVMIVAFTDYETHTSETHLLKVSAGLDMYKFAQVHQILKMVTHASMPVEEAIMKLDAINMEKDLWPRWANVLSYAVASFCTAPMFFGGNWTDAGVSFLLGLLVGLMNWLSEKVPSYAHICEITMSVVVAFIAEAMHDHVCRSAVKMAGIVILLPGYTITCSILELSSRHMISGSVRLFYAIIFSLLLGYGLTIGASLWLLVDKSNKPEEVTAVCAESLDLKWNILFVPLFAITLNIWLKAHPRQWTLAAILSMLGYMISFSTSHWAGARTEVSSALASFVIGFCGNIYQRVTHQLTFQAVVCAIFFLVPGSIGLKGAMAWFTDDMQGGVNFALQMVIAAIAISVGLFASALVVYPMGKARSAQMTF